jgi:hypothetical protein
MMWCDFCKAQQSHTKWREDIVSNFRIICVAVLTAPLFILMADAAPAQSASTDASGKPYLAGLRPPHEHPKVAAHPKTNQATNTATKSANKMANKTANKTAHKATAKNARSAITRAPAVASSIHTHARTKLTSRIAWPQVNSTADPATAEDRRMPETALQFTGDDASSNVAAPNSPRVAATKAPPAKAVAEERTIVAPADQPAAGNQPPLTNKIVQVERFQAPPQDVARVDAPPQNQTLAAASVVEDSQPKPDHKRAFGSAIAPTLAMLAGAISAALVGCWLFGFGSSRGIKLGA